MEQQGGYKKEDAYKTLELINKWIGNIDTKISFALAFQAILIGFVFNRGTPSIFKNISDSKISELKGEEFLGILFVIALYLAMFISVIFLLWGIMGKVKNTSSNQSVFFFGAIGDMSESEYIDKTNVITEGEMIKDLKQQIHINSEICNKKVRYYNKGLRLLILTVGLCFVCLVFQLI